ncbi:MAG TPA: DHHA1 domain-containing protein [Patescibacteria group bacterium]|nr:DHHA1 domain-containing protein [Patescibacteria group bacterium]
MRFRWLPTPAQPLLTAQLARQLQISPLLAQCLVNRELEDPQLIGNFLQPRLRNLADPFLIPAMSAAVDRLFQARDRGELVLIFGDYDVDGVTSTALLLEFFRGLGWRVDHYLPDRFAEGYGLTLESLENCFRTRPATLLLAVDCGSNAVDCIQSVQARKIDVLVLDHHQVSNPAPNALALVNPRAARATIEAEQHDPAQAGSVRPNNSPPAGAPPFSELCSVGLAFKLAHALLKRARQAGLPGAQDWDLRRSLDLVALGTIADLVPLTGENRILVSAGLDRLNRSERPGLVALKSVTRCQSPLTVHEVGFQLAPRLNAAGRLETAEEALRLLLANNAEEAGSLALALDAQNRERQRIEKSIAQQALNQVRARFKPDEDFVIVEGDVLWHVGVVGIVASRVLQQFNRPTIIVGGDGVHWRGSGRSIDGFNLAEALGACADLLVRHGGHAMAAGLTLQPQNIDALRSRLNEVAHRGLSLDQFQPSLPLDAEVELKEVSLECLSWLNRLNPNGQGNPPVRLYARNVRHARPLQRMGNEKQHVKMWVTDGAVTREAVWWGAGNESLPVGGYDLAFTPQLNEYGGTRCVQLKVLDWRPNLAGLAPGQGM